MAIALCLVCAFSVAAQSAPQTRIPTIFVANDQNGSADFLEGTFMFDTIADVTRITLANSVAVDGNFLATVVFYGDINEKVKSIEIPFTGSAGENAYMARGCKVVTDYLLHEKGSIKIEIPLGGYRSLICIVLCDRF